jgi:hypothetical protein
MPWRHSWPAKGQKDKDPRKGETFAVESPLLKRHDESIIEYRRRGNVASGIESLGDIPRKRQPPASPTKR